jgi:pimeloyl-ACP methyl ester carboxylesterase
MLDAKRWLIAPAFAALAGIALSGCEASKEGEVPFPPEDNDPTFKALFFSTTDLGVPFQPWPSDLLFSGTTQGTVNIPASLVGQPFGSLLGGLVNTLDGFSTTAYTSTNFSEPIDPATITASTVRVIELNMVAPNTPSSTAPVSRVLAFGTDFKAEVSPDTDSAGKILRITPLKPFRASKGAKGYGYLFVVTNGLKSTNGESAVPDDLYAASKATPSCSALPAGSAQSICAVVKWQLNVAGAVGVNPADVVLSWNYTTQSVDDTFDALAATVGPQTITAQMMAGAKTALGAADVFTGTLQVPYYSKVPANANDRSILTSFWVAGTPPPAALFPNAKAPYFVTRYNPLPVAQGGLRTIPVIGAVPNQAATGCTKPASGWPVVILGHGLQGNRTDVIVRSPIADSYASKCYVAVAIDHPLHGITDTANPFYQAANERTFNVDLINNTTNAARPDGIIDPSGVHVLATLVSYPVTARDAFRQSVVDLGVFAKSIAVRLDLNGDGVQDADPNRLHYAGLSLGGIIGVSHAKFAPGIKSAAVGAPGGVLTINALLPGRFKSTFDPALFAQSSFFVPNSTFYNNYYRDVQTLADSGDPVNHICDCARQQPLLVFQVKGDNVILNESTQTLVTAGPLRKITTLGANPMGTEGVWVNFIKGDHGTFFDPTASLEATVEMQTQAVGLALSTDAGTPAVVISDKTVVETTP